MEHLVGLGAAVAENWPAWVVACFLVAGAVIDCVDLKVPNWLTFPMILGGWLYSGIAMGWAGLAWSLFGTAVGLALLLPAYAVGGMGAGDVKLLAGVGAWMHGRHTFYAFCVSAIVGAVLAILLVLRSGAWRKHANQLWMIGCEVLTIRNPRELSAIAAERRSSMLLLPYGIPIALGAIAYFAWTGMLV
jgi:prepilin peptidase CpaA